MVKDWFWVLKVKLDTGKGYLNWLSSLSKLGPSEAGLAIAVLNVIRRPTKIEHTKDSEN